MPANRQRYNKQYDLSNCDAEPLRFIRSCQDPACMLVFYAETWRLKAYSENAPARFPAMVREPFAATPEAILGEDNAARLRKTATEKNYEYINPLLFVRTNAQGQEVRENLIAHEHEGLIILEFEPRDPAVSRAGFLMQVDRTLQAIQNAGATQRMLEATVREVKRMTGYDRVWLYQFDEDHNGDIVAEVHEPDMPSFLGLRYPHTDIPKQARELYLVNQVRTVNTTVLDRDHLLISDDDALIDLSRTANRGVSPIHQRYLQNFGTGASLSISIILDGKLWGLIACHHRSPKQLDCRMRNVLGLFSRVISGQLGLRYSAEFRVKMLQTNLIRSQLLERMNESTDIRGALLSEDDELLRMTEATGAAMYLSDEFRTTGNCPEEGEMMRIVEYLEDQESNIYHTDQFFDELPAAANFAHAPAGLIAARLSRRPAEYLFWFRPEKVQTVNWGGRPEHRKVVEDGQVKLHPAISFEKWTELQKGKSDPWLQHQLDAVAGLRNDIKEVILQRFQEIRRTNQQLVSAYEELESFSYTVSHDLRAPLRSIKSYAEILEEDYGGNLDEFGRTALDTIVVNVGRMNEFINDILEFSRLGRSDLRLDSISLTETVRDVWADVSHNNPCDAELRLDIQHDHVPGDRRMLRQVLLNLISNSLKYARPVPDAFVAVKSQRQNEEVIIEIADNGIGFDMKHAERIFGVFNRLVSEDDYEGTGVGLAVVRRIVEKHGGTISVRSEPGVGTSFYIVIPLSGPATQ